MMSCVFDALKPETVASSQAQWIEMGQVAGFHGVRGTLKIFSHTEPREAIATYQPWFAQLKTGDWVQLKVLNAKPQPNKPLLVNLQGVNNRDQVEGLNGAKLFVDQANLPRLEDGFYWHELIGLDVLALPDEVDYTTKGLHPVDWDLSQPLPVSCVNLGQIQQLQDIGPYDLMHIKQPSNGQRYLVPYIESEFVLNVDLSAGKMLVLWHPDDLA